MDKPKWYNEEETKIWLDRKGYPKKSDLPCFLAKHLQKAFEQGWQLFLLSAGWFSRRRKYLQGLRKEDKELNIYIYISCQKKGGLE